VYYVQYAHARIASLLRKAGDDAATAAVTAVDLEDPERALIKKLLAWPGEAHEAAERRAPHRVATYALELAREFTAFYEACPVLKAPDENVRALRLALSLASQQTLARALDLLGVEAPASM
jgi:arginyl-tRNA synthetase